MIRSIGALLGGAAAIAGVVIVGTMVAAAWLASPEGGVTPPYLVANLAVSFSAAVLGGWLVARLAPRRPGLHAALLAGVLAALTVPGLSSPAPGQPSWYPAALLALGVSGVAAGALLRMRGAGAPAAKSRAP